MSVQRKKINARNKYISGGLTVAGVVAVCVWAIWPHKPSDSDRERQARENAAIEYQLDHPDEMPPLPDGMSEEGKTEAKAIWEQVTSDDKACEMLSRITQGRQHCAPTNTMLY